MNEEAVIQKLFDKVEQKKQELEKIKRPEYKTNLTFSFTGELRDSKNLNVCNDGETFISILSFLIGKKKDHEQAAKTLGLSTKFKWGGYSFSDWESDLKTKAAILNVNTKTKELNLLEKKLDGLISPEMKRKLEIESIAKQLED